MFILGVAQGFGHSGSFALNVDETLGASADEDIAEAAAEADDEGMHVASFGGVMLPEWTEDVYDGLAGEWTLVEVWRRCVPRQTNDGLLLLLSRSKLSTISFLV